MRRILLIVFFAALAFSSRPCPAKEQKIKVFVTILPQAYFVERIGGETVEVSVLIPPGGNPHTFEPTPGQLVKLSKARIFFKVGTGLGMEDQWLQKISALNPNTLIVNMSAGIKLIEMEEGHGDTDHLGEHAGVDPHVWLSTDNAAVMAVNIRNGLIRLKPHKAAFYWERTAQLTEELNLLKKQIQFKLIDLEPRSFMVFHPAWGYFAEEFGLEEIAVEAGGKEPGPRDLIALIQKAKTLGIKVIFTSPQFSRKSAAMLASEIKGRVEFIDPLAKDYINNLRKVADVLAGQEETP